MAAAWAPAVVVATIVEREGRFLFVEERIKGQLMLNQPAGHLDPDESLIAAAARETLEETGWSVAPHALIGIYQWLTQPEQRQFLRFTFAADALAHDAARTLDHGIERAVWLSRDELVASPIPARSPLVQRSLEDYLAGIRVDLGVLKNLLPARVESGP
jgi:8-oxo-dGTP pyrophosphatase MutT (NUDIX family)